MSRTLRTASLFVGLLSLAVVTWIYALPEQDDSEQTRSPTTLSRGYFLRDAVLLGTDSSGHVYYRVFAGSVERSQANNDLVLERVRVEYEPEAEIHWNLSADHGRATSDRQFIHLKDRVRLSSTGPDIRDPTVVETEDLQLDVEKSIASTEALVAIVTGRTRFEAMGLEANLKSDYLRLHSNVSIRSSQ
jgi:LPS export ABC transporter protein LptC